MFGFVSAPGLPPWPATLISESGGKLKVTFFGTGKSALVDKSSWIPYTVKELSKVDTTRNKRRWGAFRAGLKELRVALESKKEGVDIRKPEAIKKSKAVGLRKEQIENEKRFTETMIRIKYKKRQWKCTRCMFVTGLGYKARAHANICNSMLRKIN